jgi:hypothetical protein
VFLQELPHEDFLHAGVRVVDHGAQPRRVLVQNQRPQPLGNAVDGHGGHAGFVMAAVETLKNSESICTSFEQESIL